MTLASPSMTSRRRPSLTFGTHSTMPGIGESVPGGGLIGLRGSGLAHPDREGFHHGVDDLDVLMEDVLELPRPEHERSARSRRRHGRGAFPAVDERDLPEEVARLHRRDLLAAARDIRRSGLKDEEVTAVRALAAEHPPGWKIHLFDLGQDEIELPLVAMRE